MGKGEADKAKKEKRMHKKRWECRQKNKLNPKMATLDPLFWAKSPPEKVYAGPFLLSFPTK